MGASHKTLRSGAGLGGAEDGVYTLAIGATGICMPLVFCLAVAFLAPAPPNEEPLQMLGRFFSAFLLGLPVFTPFWLVLTVVCSTLSLPLSSFVVRKLRRRASWRPFADISYGVALGACWALLICLAPFFQNFAPLVMFSGVSTGALVGFWFWLFDRAKIYATIQEESDRG
jgi:hypothetical protein